MTLLSKEDRATAGRPILFSAPMVNAILAGRKTQTRRVAKARRRVSLFAIEDDGSPQWADSYIQDEGNRDWLLREAACRPGDTLWVREAFSYDALDCDRDRFLEPWYWADGNPSGGDWTKPKPSIHMPRIYSRITLRCTDVRVERLQAITEAAALAEGVETTEFWREEHPPSICYSVLWNHINGPTAWEANPLVWVISFERVTP